MTEQSSTWPASPRELLDARYRAFVSSNIDFIWDSSHPQTRAQHNRQEISEWADNSEWLGYEVEEEAVLSPEVVNLIFTVRYRPKDKPEAEVVEHRELAQFRLEQGRWFYFDSTFPKPKTFRHQAEQPGRNDACSCGSGKKYKKCCGA